MDKYRFYTLLESKLGNSNPLISENKLKDLCKTCTNTKDIINICGIGTSCKKCLGDIKCIMKKNQNGC